MKQLSLLERAALTPAEIVDVIEYGPIVHASDDGRTVYTVNGSYLNRWVRSAKGAWECDDARTMPADLYRTTVAAAMTLAESWHREFGVAEPDEAPAPPKAATKAGGDRGPAKPPTTQLTERQRELLARFAVEENAATFRDADRIEDWAEVKRVFVALGATWRKGKPGRFVFPDDVDGTEKVRVALATGEIVDPRKADFFPTPVPLARELVRFAGIGEGDLVLEPSAGRGALAEVARDRGAIVRCVELLPDNAARLRALGFDVVADDFLATSPDTVGLFDAVVMNPPFGRGDDVRHVEHALRFLLPGGSLVAIMHPATRDRRGAATTAFRSRVGALGAEWIENPRGAFAESGTDVATLTLVLRNVGAGARGAA